MALEFRIKALRPLSAKQAKLGLIPTSIVYRNGFGALIKALRPFLLK